MFSRRLSKTPLLLGLLIGLVFGAVNLVFTWLYPLEDDSPGALLRFYGPMLFVWAFVAFRAARRSGRLLSGVTTGAIVVFATFSVLDALVGMQATAPTRSRAPRLMPSALGGQTWGFRDASFIEKTSKQ